MDAVLQVLVSPPRQVVAWAVGAAAIIGLLVWGVLKLYERDTLPVRFVRVEGNFQYLQTDDVRRSLEPLVKVNYLAADLRAMRRAAQSLPWIDRASISRIWPDTLLVRVDEQTPYARWGTDGLLNRRGERFVPPDLEGFETLPLIQGPAGREVFLMKVAEKMATVLAGYQLTLEALEVNERRAWSARLSGGVRIHMGREEPLKAFARLLRVLPLLAGQRFSGIESVDLRYPNGFAVGWKPGADHRWAQAPRRKN